MSHLYLYHLYLINLSSFSCALHQHLLELYVCLRLDHLFPSHYLPPSFPFLLPQSSFHHLHYSHPSHYPHAVCPVLSSLAPETQHPFRYYSAAQQTDCVHQLCYLLSLYYLTSHHFVRHFYFAVASHWHLLYPVLEVTFHLPHPRFHHGLHCHHSLKHLNHQYHWLSSCHPLCHEMSLYFH